MNDITNTALYISEKGYQITAKKFANKLFDFGGSLAVFPEKYPLCRHRQYSLRMYRCAVFEKNYVFIYKIETNHIVIYNITHVKRLG
ncbi:MAG: hypothetical protein DRJ05_12820 [Bacteroidetes bacterium]|nr:MAG: hypothetical protein DRJ05_12820 [Bacteroidota bacterium]